MYRMRKRCPISLAVLCLSIIGILALSIFVAPIALAKSTKVKSLGAIVPGTVPGMGGWSQGFYEDAQAFTKQYKLEFRVVSNVDPPAAREILKALATQVDVVYVHGEQYRDAIMDVAPQFPDTYFMILDHNDYPELIPNLYALTNDEWEPFYFGGMVAAGVTKTKFIGLIAAMPSASQIWDIKAAEAGMKRVDPNARMKWSFTGSYFNPPAAREAAESLIDAGADVVIHTSNTPTPAIVAKERGKLALTAYMDAFHLAPDSIVASQVYNWEIVLKDQVDKINAGKFQPTTKLAAWGMRQGLTDLMITSTGRKLLSKDLLAEIEELKQKVMSGDFKVPKIGDLNQAVPTGR